MTLLLALALAGCTSTTTRITAPDGTVTETTVRAVDAASVQALSAAAVLYAPRAREVRPDK